MAHFFVPALRLQTKNSATRLQMLRFVVNYRMCHANGQQHMAQLDARSGLFRIVM